MLAVTRVLPAGGARAPPAPVATLGVSVEVGGVTVELPEGVDGLVDTSGGASLSPPDAGAVALVAVLSEPLEPGVDALVPPAPALTMLGDPAVGGTTAVAEMIGAPASVVTSLGATLVTVGAFTDVVLVGVGSAFAESTGAGGAGGGGAAAATTAAGLEDTAGAEAGVTCALVELAAISELCSTLKKVYAVSLAYHVLGSSAVVAGCVVATAVAGAGLDGVDPGRFAGTTPMLSLTTAPYVGAAVALVCPDFFVAGRTRSVTTGTYLRC